MSAAEVTWEGKLTMTHRVSPSLATFLEVEIRDGHLDPAWVALVEGEDAEPSGGAEPSGILEGEGRRIAGARVLLAGWSGRSSLRLPTTAGDLDLAIACVGPALDSLDDAAEDLRRQGKTSDDRHMITAASNLLHALIRARATTGS